MRELNFSFHKNIRRNSISISFLRLGVSPCPGDTIRMTSCQVASENLATVLKNKNNSLAFFCQLHRRKNMHRPLLSVGWNV